MPLPQDYGFDEDAYQRALARWNQDEFVRGCVEWSDRCREAKLDGEKATAASNKQKAATITPDGPNQGGPAGVTTGTASSQKRSLRFKPKKPSQRYAERHPEVVTDTHSNKSDAARGNSSAHAPSSSDHPSAVEGGGDEMDIDGDGDVSDGGSSSTRSSEWVVDVYERVPASKIVGKKHNIGLIVFEDSKDQEFFYGPEGDSEDDAPGDDGNDSNGMFSVLRFCSWEGIMYFEERLAHLLYLPVLSLVFLHSAAVFFPSRLSVRRLSYRCTLIPFPRFPLPSPLPSCFSLLRYAAFSPL